jgi:4-carboxymuconolactone decarboxylase
VTGTAAPRLQPLTAAGWAAGSRDLMRGRLAAADRYLSGEADAPPMPAILGLLAHHPRLGANWLAFSGGLLDDPVLDPRDRELLVLRVAWRTQSRYEWAQHIRLGGAAGLTSDEIAAIATSDLSGRWSDRDRHLLAAADQMIDVHRVDDTTWQSLTGHFDEQQLLELLFVVGTYLCLALVLNSAGLEPDAGTDDGPAQLPLPEGSA